MLTHDDLQILLDDVQQDLSEMATLPTPWTPAQRVAYYRALDAERGVLRDLEVAGYDAGGDSLREEWDR